MRQRLEALKVEIELPDGKLIIIIVVSPSLPPHLILFLNLIIINETESKCVDMKIF